MILLALYITQVVDGAWKFKQSKDTAKAKWNFVAQSVRKQDARQEITGM